jgi:hypothetical protein
VIHVSRDVERDLAANITALRGYRQARWRAVILYGVAGTGKTAIARVLADDDQVKRTFRDGIAWVDGSQDPQEEAQRLCLGFGLEREPGERWVECWRRWAGADERRLLVVVDGADVAARLPAVIAGLGSQVVLLVTTREEFEARAEVERWVPAEAVRQVEVGGLAPEDGRQLVAAVMGRQLDAEEFEAVELIGQRVDWHVERLRRAAIKAREKGWQRAIGDLENARLP